jgi:hypothetical protein
MISPSRYSSWIALLGAFLTAPLQSEQLVVGAADFHARKSEGHFFDSNGWVEGSLEGGGDGCLVASVPLPHDALVSQVLLQVYDNRSVEDFRIDLKRKRRGNSVPAEVVAGASTAGASTSHLQIAVPIAGGGHLVQDAFVYFLSTESNCLDGSDHRIYAVRITYQLALFADGFESGDTAEWSAPPPIVFSEWASGIDFKSYRHYPWTIDSILAMFWIENGSGTDPCAVARLELPHGATVAGFLANLWDSRGDSGISLNLRRKSMANSTTPGVMASTATTGSNGWHLVSDFTVANATIDNDTYWYWLDLCITGNDNIATAELGVQSVQVLYSLP